MWVGTRSVYHGMTPASLINGLAWYVPRYPRTPSTLLQHTHLFSGARLFSLVVRAVVRELPGAPTFNAKKSAPPHGPRSRKKRCQTDALVAWNGDL
jgi:hypothetical protein